MKLPPKSFLPAALGAVALLGLAACGGPGNAASSGGPTATASAAPIAVVASTSVYGSIVKEIGGDKVAVESMVSKVSQDPHSYEATTQDRLKVAKAKLVVVNGAGYDAFMDGMIKDAGLSADSILTAVPLSGLQKDPKDGDFNEHVWYSFPAMQKVAQAVQDRLSALAPASAAEFKHNTEAFTAKLGEYQATLEKLKRTPAVPAAITEPVPLYLLQAAGIENVTPDEFSHAIEEGHDVAPAVMDETLKLFPGKKAALLAYNEQTTGPQSDAVKKAAETAKVPVLGFTETLPEGKDYLSWMGANVDQVKQAVENIHG